MPSLVDQVPSRSDEDLLSMRRNAMEIILRKNDSRAADAEILLKAIEAEFEKRRIPGMIDRFREQFPEGFHNGLHFEEEREYKKAACDYCHQALSESEMKRLLESDDWDELFQRVKKLVSMTNLIQGSFEKPKLLDAIKEPEHAKKFHHALYTHLHGAGTPAERLEGFAEVLEQMNLLKWTYATYFLFLNEPDVCMFVKPEGIKKSLQMAQYPLVYEPTPSAILYDKILKFSEWLKQKISQLEPRDMIDVQSFIWYMAPTGKWSEDK